MDLFSGDHLSVGDYFWLFFGRGGGFDPLCDSLDLFESFESFVLMLGGGDYGEELFLSAEGVSIRVVVQF